jgi:Protein of unknown function (DUF1488)
MSLSFTPHGAIYDPAKDLMRFNATDGALLVPCGVSKNALLALDPELPREARIIARLYERNRQRIEAIADKKYQARRIEKSGMVIVHLSDLQAKTGDS